MILKTSNWCNKAFKSFVEVSDKKLSFKRTVHTWGTPNTARTSHPCVTQIPTTSPNSLVILARVKITEPNQSHTNTQESRVHKVRLGWGEPFEKTAMSSLARELKILVSVVRFRPGPPYIHGTYRTHGLHPVPTTWFTPLPITSPILWDQMDCLRLVPYAIPYQSKPYRNP